MLTRRSAVFLGSIRGVRLDGRSPLPGRITVTRRGVVDRGRWVVLRGTVTSRWPPVRRTGLGRVSRIGAGLASRPEVRRLGERLALGGCGWRRGAGRALRPESRLPVARPADLPDRVGAGLPRPADLPPRLAALPRPADLLPRLAALPPPADLPPRLAVLPLPRADTADPPSPVSEGAASTEAPATPSSTAARIAPQKRM
jgi:hypothetical protein